MWEIMLPQTLLVSIGSKTQKIPPSDWTKWHAFWQYVISLFDRPIIISDGLTNGLWYIYCIHLSGTCMLMSFWKLLLNQCFIICLITVMNISLLILLSNILFEQICPNFLFGQLISEHKLPVMCASSLKPWMHNYKKTWFFICKWKYEFLNATCNKYWRIHF